MVQLRAHCGVAAFFAAECAGARPPRLRARLGPCTLAVGVLGCGLWQDATFPLQAVRVRCPANGRDTVKDCPGRPPEPASAMPLYELVQDVEDICRGDLQSPGPHHLLRRFEKGAGRVAIEGRGQRGWLWTERCWSIWSISV
jgi:hypothetical protein